MLRFTPYAWAKLLCLRDAGPSEVGGFGIADSKDPLLVANIELVTQRCTPSTVEFGDESVADLYDRQVDAGRTPSEFARIWIHTHPGRSAQPSGTDEETFDRAFGGPDWAVMFIIAQNGSTYGRLRFNVGPGVSMRLGVDIDYTTDFAATATESWLAEYDEHVQIYDPFANCRSYGETNGSFPKDEFGVMESDFADWHTTQWVAS